MSPLRKLRNLSICRRNYSLPDLRNFFPIHTVILRLPFYVPPPQTAPGEANGVEERRVTGKA